MTKNPIKRRAAIARRLRKAIEQAGSPEERVKVVNRIREKGKNILIKETQANIGRRPRWHLSNRAFPNDSTNYVDTAWQIVESGPDSAKWSNANPIYKFLDKGTVGHGPVTAKRLFIPLNEQTALAYINGELKFGGSGGTTPYAEESDQWVGGSRRKTYRRKQMGRKKNQNWVRRKLIWGVDFVLKEWVSGIAARNITDKARVKIKAMIQAEIANFKRRFAAKISKIEASYYNT
ncbi:hypothetical protein CCP3SC15_3340005 [Gammaproteobacteria bacterium]